MTVSLRSFVICIATTNNETALSVPTHCVNTLFTFVLRELLICGMSASNVKGRKVHMDSTEWLRLELSKRRQKNPAFSLRAFAKLLGTQPGRLSEFLSRKRPLTPLQIKKFASKLALPPSEASKLLRDANQNFPNSKKSGVKPHYIEVDATHFEIIAQPIHYRILAAMELSSYDGSPKWLANKLATDIGEVYSALERLQTAGLAERNEKGHWKPVASATTTSTDIPSAALRAAHRTSICHAISCLDEVAVEMRDITSVTMAVNLQQLGKAKELIRNFRRQLASELEIGDRSDVYELNIQLVPISKTRK